MAQTQDQLKAKYQNVLNTIQQVNGSLKNVNMDGDKLLIRAEVANEALKDQVWNAIKQTDASWADLQADIIVNSSLQAPASAAASPSDGNTKYTVQAGDNLTRIAQKFYGKASAYTKIFDANRDKLSDPDHVQVGMELVIPAQGS